MSIISALIILPFSFTANSALSATTTKTIQGTAPYLTTALTDEIKAESFSLLGFGFSGTEYYNTNLSSLYIDPTQYSPASLTSAIKGVVKSPTGTEALDDDGDGNFGLSASSALDVLVTIYNDSGGEIPSNTTKTFRELLCSSTASKPYIAKIKIAGDLSLTTAYGDPRNKDYTDSTPETNIQPSKEYEVPIAAICNLKPASMQIYTGTANVDIKYAIGYNDTKFDPTNGFKVSSGFPTTGFYKAVFSLIGSGDDQKDYKCERESGGNWVNYSTSAASDKLGEGCEITYNVVTRPSESITIKMSYKGTKVDSFTIPVPTKWAIGKGRYAYKSSDGNLASNGTFPASSMCKNNTTTSVTTAAAAKTYFFKRNELTNSPYANQTKYPEWSVPSLSLPLTDRFSRDADSTFMGEWGYVYNSYSGSGWASNSFYWTAETVSATHQFSVHTLGTVHVYASYPTNPDIVALCKG